VADPNLALHYDFVKTPDLNAETTTRLPGPPLTLTRSGVATRTNALGLIENVAVDVARFEHNPVAKAVRGLLMERAETNIALQSGNMVSAPWTSIGTPGLETNSTASPTGLVEATLLTDNSATVTEGVQQIITVASDTNFRAISIYVKKTFGGTAPTFALQTQYTGGVAGIVSTWWLNTDTGETDGTANQGVQDQGDYWRLMGIAVNSSTNTNLVIKVFPAWSAHDPLTSGDDPVQDVAAAGIAVVWGMQVTLPSGAIASTSSYIPTTTVPVTRGVDDAFTTDMSWLTGDVHTLYAQWLHDAPPGDQALMQISDGTNGDVIEMEMVFGGSVGFTVGATTLNDDIGTTPGFRGINRAAFTLKDGDQRVMVNGTNLAAFDVLVEGTVTGAAYPAFGNMTTLHIGNTVGAGNALFGLMQEIRYYNASKPDQFLQDLSNGLINEGNSLTFRRSLARPLARNLSRTF